MEMYWSEYKDDSFHVGAMLTWLFKWEVYQSLEGKEKGGEKEKRQEKRTKYLHQFSYFFFLLGNVTGLYEKQGRKTSLLLTTVNLKFLI